MRTRLVRACQALTAGAALFTVLWACGDPPTRPSAADIAGTWEGPIQPPPEPALSARLVISAGNAPIPTLTIGDTTYEANPSPGSVVTGNNFVLNVRNGQTLVTLTGQVAPDRSFLSGQVTGLSPTSRFFTFQRR